MRLGKAKKPGRRAEATHGTPDRHSAGGGLSGIASTLWRDKRGAVAIYVAMVSLLLLGSGVLAIDYGRMTVLRTQMQNAADAAALAGAVELDGYDDARERAEQVARTAASQSGLLLAGVGSLDVTNVVFFSQISPDVTATSDEDAVYIRVTMVPQDIDLILEPVIARLTSRVSEDTVELTAFATAKYEPIICNTPPLMICNPAETGGPNLLSSSSIGKQVRIKAGPGGNSPAPGQYGLLCPLTGNCGASNIGNALAAVTQPQCTGPEVETAPGVRTQQVREGINSRFGTSRRFWPSRWHGVSYRGPARNIINYPRDNNITNANDFGNGDWDRNAYWTEMHSGTLPGVLANASRYQVYLYELGETFAVNGSRTIYPVPDPLNLPPGYALNRGLGETPVSTSPTCTFGGYPNPDCSGQPFSPPDSDPKRRIIKVAVLNCQDLGVRGRGTYLTNGRYIDVFVTEEVPRPPDASIYGEVVSPLTARTSGDVHANVRLVE